MKKIELRIDEETYVRLAALSKLTNETVGDKVLRVIVNAIANKYDYVELTRPGEGESDDAIINKGGNDNAGFE